jgi:hypothetical protein
VAAFLRHTLGSFVRRGIAVAGVLQAHAERLPRYPFWRRGLGACQPFAHSILPEPTKKPSDSSTLIQGWGPFRVALQAPGAALALHSGR